MTDQERIRQLELEVAVLRGKISVLEAQQRFIPYPVPQPVYSWQPPFIYHIGYDNAFDDGHYTTCIGGTI